MPSPKTIGRLSLYRRLLFELQARGVHSIFSHQLAAMAGVTSAQARRDLMQVRHTGSPQQGYDVDALAQAIGAVIDVYPGPEPVVLVGLGNLGRAIVAFFRERHPRLAIVAAFDADPEKAGRVIQGTRCYPLDALTSLVEEHQARVGIITVPAVAAQETAIRLIGAGVRGILNFAPAPLQVPAGVYCENLDMTLTLEKVAFFARQK